MLTLVTSSAGLAVGVDVVIAEAVIHTWSIVADRLLSKAASRLASESGSCADQSCFCMLMSKSELAVFTDNAVSVNVTAVTVEPAPILDVSKGKYRRWVK